VRIGVALAATEVMLDHVAEAMGSGDGAPEASR
jgi:hypothetical protein